MALPREEQSVDALLEELRQLRTALTSLRNIGNPTVSINAGGMGVWVAATACFVMLAALMVGGFWISRELNQIEVRFSDMKNTNDIQDAYDNKFGTQLEKLKQQQAEKK